MAEQTVIFFVDHNGVERPIELPEYDVVEDLKLKICEFFDIPPNKQIIRGWKNIPKTDKTILQSCGDVSTVTFLTVQCLEQTEYRAVTNNLHTEVLPNDDGDEKAAISGYTKIRNDITSGVVIHPVTLADAVARSCLTNIQERKVLLLYLHNGEDNFSRLFLKNMKTEKVSKIAKEHFFALAWDVENTLYHADMVSALDEFNLSYLANLVQSKTCCVLLIQNIDGCIALNSRLSGTISDKDFLAALTNLSSFLVDGRKKELELQKLEKDAGNVNDITSTRYQQLMFDMLGDRDYDCFEFNQHEELKNKISFALFGPPQQEEGYNSKQKAQVETIYGSVIENNNEISQYKDRVEISFIYNCTEPLPSEKIARAKKYGRNNYNPNTDVMPIPIFVLRKCHESNDPCRIFIDDIGRVYKTWEQYLNKNKLHACKMVLPRHGRYESDVNENVLLETHLSPACGLDIKILKGADIVSVGAGITSGGIFVAALIPAITVAPALIATAAVVGAGTGLYAIGRSIHTLVDRSVHRETLSFANSEARGAYINIVAGSLGFVGAGANMAVTQLAARGFNIGQGAGAVVNTLGVVNIGASGASLVNSTYEMFDQWINENQTPSMLTIVQLTSSILFFGNAVYNFKSCSSIVEETQTRALQDYQESLRSNRHRKTFNKLMKETIRRNDGNQASGKAEVISAIRKMPNKDEVFAALTRSNKAMNKNGVKFFANDGQITLNGQPIDISNFTTMDKKATSAFLSKLPVKSDVTVTDVATMKTNFSSVEIPTIDVDSVCRYAVRLLGCYTGSIQALIITALKDFLGVLTEAMKETINELFPNSKKYFNLLNMLIEFFGRIALQRVNKAAGGRNKDEYMRLFEIGVEACFSGGHLTDVFLKELIKFFTNWLANQMFHREVERETESQRREHSGRPRVKAHCCVCGGYSFKDT